jgi:starvation-inducible DNA-binding protein
MANKIQRARTPHAPQHARFGGGRQPPHRTQNDLPVETRTNVAALCNARLADTMDLMHQAKQAHWNVKGRNFIALHELFDTIAAASIEWMDLIGERVVQLGGLAEGTIQATAGRTELEEYPLHAAHEREHVAAVSAALAAYGKRVRQAIDQADELGDKDTADIFTEVSRGVDKNLWFVEAHQQADD